MILFLLTATIHATRLGRIEALLAELEVLDGDDDRSARVFVGDDETQYDSSWRAAREIQDSSHGAAREIQDDGAEKTQLPHLLRLERFGWIRRAFKHVAKAVKVPAVVTIKAVKKTIKRKKLAAISSVAKFSECVPIQRIKDGDAQNRALWVSRCGDMGSHCESAVKWPTGSGGRCELSIWRELVELAECKDVKAQVDQLEAELARAVAALDSLKAKAVAALDTIVKADEDEEPKAEGKPLLDITKADPEKGAAIAAGTFGDLPLFKRDEACTAGDPCDACEGDCDEDEDCKGELICKSRDHNHVLEPAHGCMGLGEKGIDYCYAPGRSKTLRGRR